MLSVWSQLKQQMHTGFVERRRDRRSRTATVKQQTQQQFRWKRSLKRSLSGVFTANCSEEQSSLDVSKHRCSSIESLLSLEQSFVTYDDQNNIQLIPRVCRLSNAGNNNIPLEVGIPNDNDNGEVTESDSNVGLDISGSSDEDEGAAATEESKNKEEGNDSKENSSSESQEKATAELESAIECLQSAALEARRNISSILPLSSTIMPIDSDATILKAVAKPPPEDCQSILRSSFSKIANTAANRDSGSNRSTSVRFGSVEVHQHEQGLGQSSVPMYGPPLGLGWKRISYEKYATVDEHLEKHAQRGGQPRSLKQLFQPSRQRVDTLLRLGCSLREIRHATRETGVIKTKRLHSSRYSDRSKSFVCVFISKIFKTYICLPHRNKTKMKASQDAGQSTPNKKVVPTSSTNIDDTVRTQGTIATAR